MLTRLQVLCPITSVPVIIGIGLNYKVHAEEAKVRRPPRLSKGAPIY